ncbi:hypothetical protein KHP57_01655 [Algiphilus sp. NNCM1]|jgi:hypothetical protein|uniref:hypothetical protein n=1 Tax=Algiphilus sp. TaxID=1872431 RepID=UPI001CA755B2|nr:hypothetical protein [Algiphilus sp.]MBY8964395.1 hypothetical protein [Algiphilus acroporae]MCI5063778.1 hypothetical protein [Algiphilus sp.]MCI5103979.1 hypothetical protein [Algiphilus sp.]
MEPVDCAAKGSPALPGLRWRAGCGHQPPAEIHRRTELIELPHDVHEETLRVTALPGIGSQVGEEVMQNAGLVRGERSESRQVRVHQLQTDGFVRRIGCPNSYRTNALAHRQHLADVMQKQTDLREGGGILGVRHHCLHQQRNERQHRHRMCEQTTGPSVVMILAGLAAHKGGPASGIPEHIAEKAAQWAGEAALKSDQLIKP